MATTASAARALPVLIAARAAASPALRAWGVALPFAVRSVWRQQQQQQEAQMRPLRRIVGGGAARAYSQQAAAAEGESKIWDFAKLQKLISEEKPQVVIVDTREPAELASTGRIPGALNIPIKSAPDSFHISAEEFEDRFGFRRPAPEQEVVFYCKAGVRSRAAAALARQSGWKNVGEYPGSWVDWEGNGGEAKR